MSIRPNELYDLSDKELLQKMGSAQPGSMVVHTVESEFRRRAIVAQIEAADATKKTARWTMFSAIAIAVSVVVMAVGTFIP